MKTKNDVFRKLLYIGLFAGLKQITEASPNFEFECETSDQIINGTSGIIKSSNIRGAADDLKRNGTYPSNAFCIWEADLPAGKFITFRFLMLNIELINNCENDRVEIYDDQDTYERFCGFGEHIPNPLTLSTDNRIYVNFISDDIMEYSGFELEYEIHDEHPCDVERENFICRNRLCISSVLICNGRDECGDGSDEEMCGLKTIIPKICGVPLVITEEGNNRDRRIVGGKVSIPGSWPWQISLQNSFSSPSGHFCGGALINNNWIVTAGHCLTGKALSQLSVVLGRHSRYNIEKDEVIRYANKTCTHPDYNRDVLKNDIALIKLNARVAYTINIHPVCLPKRSEELSPGTLCHVTGWGRTMGTGNHDYLKQVEIPVIDHKVCELMPKAVPLFEHTICLGFPNGKNAPCFGDSGGPVVSRNNEHYWKLEGLVSSGPGTCGTGREPNVCTKVSAHVDWIHKQIESENNGDELECLNE